MFKALHLNYLSSINMFKALIVCNMQMQNRRRSINLCTTSNSHHITNLAFFRKYYESACIIHCIQTGRQQTGIKKQEPTHTWFFKCYPVCIKICIMWQAVFSGVNESSIILFVAYTYNPSQSKFCKCRVEEV